MNKRSLNILPAALLTMILVMFPAYTGVAGADSPCRDGKCRQQEEMKTEWKAIYIQRIDADVLGAAGDVLSYILLRDLSDKDAFYQKMLSFHRIARGYRDLAKVDRYGEDRGTEAYFRLYDAQEQFEQAALALLDGVSKDPAPSPKKLNILEHTIDTYEKAGKTMKNALLAGITPEMIKKDPELHGMLTLAEMMVTALDGIQEAYAYILMNDEEERNDFFAKMAAFSDAAARFKELASVGQKGEEKRTSLYADVLTSQKALVNAAKKMFASYEKTKTPPNTEIAAFKKDAQRLTSLVEELINLMGSEGVSPCSAR